jgi:hypothetical protein
MEIGSARRVGGMTTGRTDRRDKPNRTPFTSSPSIAPRTNLRFVSPDPTKLAAKRGSQRRRSRHLTLLPDDYNYGCFDFVDLFARALFQAPYDQLARGTRVTSSPARSGRFGPHARLDTATDPRSVTIRYCGVFLDSDGNIVIVELKKGKAPREVVAQILEYAAWVSELPPQRVEQIAEGYLDRARENSAPSRSLMEAFQDTFEVDEVPVFNRAQRLFVAAEEIPPGVARVCRYLRTSHGLDVNCVAFSVFQTESGEVLVNSDWIVGHEDVGSSSSTVRSRWVGDKPAKQVVWEAAQEVTGGDKAREFSPREVKDMVLKKYPSFNKSTVGCQIISDCVNHKSRHHYPGGADRYWWLGKGKYRLFDSEKDAKGG